MSGDISTSRTRRSPGPEGPGVGGQHLGQHDEQTERDTFVISGCMCLAQEWPLTLKFDRATWPFLKIDMKPLDISKNIINMTRAIS